MLESIFGNINKERILLFLYTQNYSYAREMSRVFNVSLRSIQLQLKNLESGAVIVSFLKGRTREYQLNPRFFLLKELKNLLNKLYKAIPEHEKKQHYRIRRRPIMR